MQPAWNRFTGSFAQQKMSWGYQAGLFQKNCQEKVGLVTAQFRSSGHLRATAASRNLDQNQSSPLPDGLLRTVGAALVDPPTWWYTVGVTDPEGAPILLSEPPVMLFP